jgi:U4/U6 small nuclear ribonucleoprotein PRP31
MSLAEELLADLDEAGDQLEEEVENEGEDVVEALVEMETSDNQSVRSIARLSDSDKLNDILKQIDYNTEHPSKADIRGPVEANPEYKLTVDANNIVVEIDNEMNIIHKYVKDHYCKRFPELDSLVHTPIEYCKCVKLLGNQIEVSKANLQDFLPAATVMVVSVTASTTQGQQIEQEEVDMIEEACDMMEKLNETKLKILQYVEGRMSLISPNLSAIVGSTVAAKLMGVAGGLTNLSKMPACNILVLGAQRKVLAGFSTASVLPHTGFVYYCELVQSTPEDIRKKASRLVSCKCTLAARVDSFHESPDGAIGRNLREEIEKKLDKWQEPPPVKMAKPLPKPEDAPRKKRGGRR